LRRIELTRSDNNSNLPEVTGVVEATGIVRGYDYSSGKKQLRGADREPEN
jgi:hypothetical protein